MNARTSRILIPLAAVVFVASLVGLGVSVTKLFFSSHPPAAVHIVAGGTAPAKALLASSGYRAGTPADSLQNKSQPIAGNTRLNNRVNPGLQYSIFHPPPVVCRHLPGILNSKFSYPVRFIMAMAACPGGQTVAMATEGQGLVMFRPAARPPHRWVQFHPNKDGTGTISPVQAEPIHPQVSRSLTIARPFCLLSAIIRSIMHGKVYYLARGGMYHFGQRGYWIARTAKKSLSCSEGPATAGQWACPD